MLKNLPIQFVETRGEQDVFLKEGGGGSELPKWVTQDTIQKNIASIRKAFKSLDTIFENRATFGDEELPLLSIVKLHEKATAKSYRANARVMFDGKRKRNIIGVKDTGRLVVKIDNKAELIRVEKKYEEAVKVGSKMQQFSLAAIEDLQPFYPYVEEDLLGHPIKVRLIDYLDCKLNEKSEMMFLQKCAENHLRVRKADYGMELRMFSIDSTQDSNAIQALATMDSVISVKKMPYIELSISPEPENTKLEVKMPKNGENYPIVGLLDSGVTNLPHLAPWMQGDNQNTADFADEDIDLRHGTAVAGILNYGDELEDQHWTGCAPMRIVSCIINTNPSCAQVEEIEMIEYIRSAVVANPDVKIWNLSQGSKNPITDNNFSEFAISLDDIQRKHNVLFCKSAGNYNWKSDDNGRIRQGADSVLSLVVGSITHRCDDEEDVQVGLRSPFSCKGPGPEFLIKPDLVHYGGNANSGVQSFAISGFQCKGLAGTSFSTPRVSALAANLAHRINKVFDPILIKALLVHHANYLNIGGLVTNDLLNEQGYGLPSNLNSMLNNDDDEFTMIWQPSLDLGDAQIQDIPFPESMIGDDGLFYGDITVTVVSDPILKATEGSEYCQSDVEVLLQTYEGINYIPLNAMGISRYYRNAERLHNPQNILAKNIYSSRSLKSSDLEERTLIESDFKYQPIKKYHVNLEMMRPAMRQVCLSSNRKWCLSVKARYRDAVSTDREYDGTLANTKATIIITIRDPKHKGVAYRECYSYLDQHNFTHSNLDIQQHVQVANNN